MMRTFFFGLAVVSAIGCGRSGLGPGFRQDVETQMSRAREPMSACYAEALQRNANLQGTLVLQFTAEPKSGRFTNVSVPRDDLGDAELTSCVTTQVASLQLEQPTDTKVDLEYPVEFTPAN